MLLQIIYFFITKKLLKLEQEFGFEDGGEYKGELLPTPCSIWTQYGPENGPNVKYISLIL
jgi:hypothetical protein